MTRDYHNWTIKEEEQLKVLYRFNSALQISLFMDIPLGSIENKIRKLGLRKHKAYVRLTTSQVRAAVNRVGAEQAARELGCDRSAVYQRLNRTRYKKRGQRGKRTDLVN